MLLLCSGWRSTIPSWRAPLISQRKFLEIVYTKGLENIQISKFCVFWAQVFFRKQIFCSKIFHRLCKQLKDKCGCKRHDRNNRHYPQRGAPSVCAWGTSDLSLKWLNLRPILCLPSCDDLVAILTMFYHLFNPSTGLWVFNPPQKV